jgi:hypothetical protein
MTKWKPYKSYYFKTHDPVLTRVSGLIADYGGDLKAISGLSGVSVSCMRRWMEGTTRRPTYAAVTAVIQALGCEIEIRQVKPKLYRIKRPEAPESREGAS